MLVKTINQFGRHIPSAGGHEGGGRGPGPRRSPTPFPDGCVGSGGGGQARPLWSKKAQQSCSVSASVLLLEKERVASGAAPGPGAWLRLTSRSLYFCIETGPRNINIKYDWITD